MDRRALISRSAQRNETHQVTPAYQNPCEACSVAIGMARLEVH